jgi:hypothetical protein
MGAYQMTRAKAMPPRRLSDIKKVMQLTGPRATNGHELDLIYKIMVQAGIYAEPVSKQKELLLKIIGSPEFKARITKVRDALARAIKPAGQD